MRRHVLAFAVIALVFGVGDIVAAKTRGVISSILVTIFLFLLFGSTLKLLPADLLPQLDNEQLADLERYLRRCKPRLGQDFIRNARGLLTDDIRRDLAELKDFTFRQHPHIHAEQERLDALSRIVQNQIGLILSDWNCEISRR